MDLKSKHIIIGCILLITTSALRYQTSRYKIYAINERSGICSQKHQLSLMTFNVNAFGSSSFTPNRQKTLLQLIVEEKPDILCLQEMSFVNLKKIKPQLDSIYGPCEVLKGDNQLWRLRLYSHYPLRNFKRHECVIDVAGFTEKEISEVEMFKKQMNVMSAEFEIEPNRWVTIFSGHLRSSAYSTARRSMDKDANWLEGISLYKRNHEIGKRIRDYEARNVRRFVDEARVEGMPVIIAGDLNDWCGSDCLDLLMGKDLKDAWWEGGNGFGWTYFGWHLRLRLDHILYSDEFELVDVNVVDSDLSDHKPLIAKFILKN